MIANKRNIVIKREYSKELAEFIGILYGDGHINKHKNSDYIIDIAGHSKNDLEYHKRYIKPLIQMLFNLEPKLIFKKNQNTLYTRIRSKEIFYFMKEAGVPTGRKNCLIVPDWIKNDGRFFISFTRGLFDTDGSVVVRKRGQHSISLNLKNEELIDEIKLFLESLDYFVAKYKDKKSYCKLADTYCIRVNRKKLIRRFMEEIGSSNPYKLERLMKINGTGGI